MPTPPLETSPYTFALMQILEHSLNPDLNLDEDLDRSYGITIIDAINNELQQAADKNLRIVESHYTFKRYIAIGGDAVIIKAYCEKKKRDVAVKVSLPRPPEKTICSLSRVFLKNFFAKKASEETPVVNEKLLSNSAAARFNRGATLQMQLAKKIEIEQIKFGYIPKVFEIGASQKAFFTMEYCDDPPLEKWIKTANLYQRIRLFENILMLFERAIHSVAIVHSDIKPENFLVRDGRPVLLDFNIAKNIGRPSNLTLPTSQIGSPLYSPPEITKAPQNRSYLVDIYQLGILLHIIISQTIPDPTKLIDPKLINIYHIFPPQLLPPEIQPIYIKATQENPEDRYDDISTFRKAFEDLAKLHMHNMKPLLQSTKKSLPKGWQASIPTRYLKTVSYFLKAMDYTWED